MKEKINQFKLKCREYLSRFDIHTLRGYGRYIGVNRPAAKNKEELLDDIVAILAGEMPPVPISNRGAPVKNKEVDHAIVARIEELKAEYYASTLDVDDDLERRAAEAKKNALFGMVMVADPQEEERGFIIEEVVRGQVVYQENGYFLYPVDCAENKPITPIPAELIEEHDLRYGDIITCYNREKEGRQKVGVVLTINDRMVNFTYPRGVFEESGACYSKERLCVFHPTRHAQVSQKYAQWLLPILKGQRACIISQPKAGKTKLLLQLAESINNLNERAVCFALLVDQSLETVGEFRRIFDKERLFYTTYEDDVERQVFVAEFVLQRAKRCAEYGKDVVIFIDGLSALAGAFNDTEFSVGGKTLSCGLETKTIRYLKKYFGTARCLESGGSITIVGTVSVSTGNPADEIIASEMCDLATLELWLSGEMAMRRIYPAIDIGKASNKQSALVQTESEEDLDFVLRNELLPKVGAEGVIKILSESASFEEFSQAVYDACKSSK